MITPRFNIEQTETDLIFTIHAPYASIADAEVYADLDIFCFYASPYYLRLHLSGFIEETDSSKGSYDADKGTFVLCVQKVNKGEHFENLDLITSLLTPSQRSKNDIAKPVIEVINGDVESEEESCSGDEDGSEWYIDQCPIEEPDEDFFMKAPPYGFANKLSGVFHNFKVEFLEVIELPDPDKTPMLERSRMRLDKETEDFSDDHYLADWAQPEMIEPIMNFEPSWNNGAQVSFLDEEVDIMKDFPKKEFLLEKKEEHLALLSLVDILFAYAYNVRTTLGENTVESAWTVNKLSATLSWLQTFSNLKEAVSAPIRRSLCYPLYRHWELSMKVLNDVKTILKLGRRRVLKCLLEVYVLFNMSEPRYLLNQLYIRDYCIWIQHTSDSQIKSLLEGLLKVDLCKADVDLDLDELENAALIVQREEKGSEIEGGSRLEHRSSKITSQGRTSEQTLCKDIAALSLDKKCVDTNSSSGTSDSEDDSSSSSASDDSSTSSSQSSGLDSDDLSENENI